MLNHGGNLGLWGQVAHPRRFALRSWLIASYFKRLEVEYQPIWRVKAAAIWLTNG